MSKRKALIPFLIIINLLISACVYIVLPEGLDTAKSKESKGWSAVVTNVSQTAAGDLRIDLTIRNQTNDWSMMKAVEGKPAVLSSDGKTTNCDGALVGTGGHRLAPGFQMRGYTAGTKAEPKTQLIYVECKGAQLASGAKLTIDYISYSGELDYYHQEEGSATGTLKLDLDKVETDLTYPIYEPVEALLQKKDVSITGLSDNVLTLLDTQRTEKGFEFKWQNYNPTEFALKLHIGNPPVIGSDGIIYGYYEIMDLASTPLTPAGGKVEWVTKAAVPQDVKDCYILLSVESKNMRLYVNYALDITDK
jgi:hypothetical protein